MPGDLNPIQFASLDYSNADMYGGLNQRPPTATPLNIPLENLSAKPPSTNQSALEQAFNRSEEVRRQSLFNEQQEAQAQREQALREREIARNQALQKTRNSPIEQPTVSSRDYESRFQAPSSNNAQQSPPSTGEPPPTTKGTAARASPLVEPTARPATGTLAEAIPAGVGVGLLEALPRALPQAAGRLVVPGVFGGIDFANRVVHGQSVQQAAAGAAAGQIGAGIGFVVGSAVGGPLLGLVGGAIGGLIGGFISDMFFAQQIPSTGTPRYDPVGAVPFIGGQLKGVYYRIFIAKYNSEGTVTETRTFINQRGVIKGFKEKKVRDDGTFNTVLVVNNGDTELELGDDKARWLKLECSRMDGEPDVIPAPVIPAPPPDNHPGYYNESPLNSDNAIPSGRPSEGQPTYPRRDVAPTLPGNNLPNSNSPYFPGHGGLAPSYLPNPTQTPSNGGGMLPAIQNIAQPLPFADPDDFPSPRTRTFDAIGVSGESPAGGGSAVAPAMFPDSIVPLDAQGNVIGTDIDGKIPEGFKANPLIPNPLTLSINQPKGLPLTAPPLPTPDGISPTPKVNTAPIAETPDETAQKKQTENNEANKKDFDDQIKRLTAIATAIAALTPAIQGLPDAIAKSPAVKASTQGAVCELTQPQGCIGKAIDNSADKVNQNNNQNAANILDKINAGANAAQLALLELINTKLGDLLPGGLSATFTRLWQTLQVDRVISILTLITTFHNGLMLSNNLAQTLFGAIDNISQAAGFKWKNEKGEESGFSSIVSEWTANFFKSIFGEENYTELVAEYKKANRIYQATANIFNALQSIGYSILSALEVVGSYVALIGNALKKWGEVGESAYRWFNPQPNFHNKFFTTIEGVTNVVSQVDQLASEVVSIEQNITQIGELKNELNKSIGQNDASKQGAQPPEAAKIKAVADASKLVSASGIAISDSDKEADE
ncbi:MAG: hypothetical protein HWQ35_00575 [Nostoc sp. NMS1]|uniref:hypothetical protein n=1 Tax=unclassified Nostoc TaxID=2593658 RepID=UPI0025F96C78|nr:MULTISPECIES: hypothetical protein [unclassified Nostoc]MBN3905120.1 hypothetical protein [Nostoc sp. NMS1]MBN3989224.1 hypothetical protein [Nostoc sp. NMS2]